MNAIINAVKKAESHLNSFNDNPEDVRLKELNNLKKAELIEIIISMETFRGTKVEDLVKPILADEDCSWLDYETIAAMIRKALPTAKTTGKSIASYASKYPTQKGWTVIPRKSQKQRMAELMSLNA